MWTGESDLNTLRVDGEIYEQQQQQALLPNWKKLGIKEYPDTYGQSLNLETFCLINPLLIEGNDGLLRNGVRTPLFVMLCYNLQ